MVDFVIVVAVNVKGVAVEEVVIVVLCVCVSGASEPRCGGGCVWVAGAVAGGFASVAGASVAGASGVGGAGVLGVGGLWL